MYDCELIRRVAGFSAASSCYAPVEAFGRVTSGGGLSIRVNGLSGWLSVGDRLELTDSRGAAHIADAIGFGTHDALVMSHTWLTGLGTGALAILRPKWHAGVFEGTPGRLPVSNHWLGRVIDPHGRPLDDQGPLPEGTSRSVASSPAAATSRARLGDRIDVGVGVLNAFVPVLKGQRLGIFSGAGAGKSTLMGMLARFSACEVLVVALIGERGREVREFLDNELSADRLSRAVVVVATSDTPPLMRREAAYVAMTIAEHFRDEGRSVLLLMDSVSRFCAALREIALSVGEAPASRGYPPSVFAELPRLLERAGPGVERADGSDPGYVTAFFTILVEGDDDNEPIADAARGFLDGHIKLDRKTGESGRYPAVDVLGSLSRTAQKCLSKREIMIAKQSRAVLSTWKEMREIVTLGVYRPGSDQAVDAAIQLIPRLEAAITQDKDQCVGFEAIFTALELALGSADGSQTMADGGKDKTARFPSGPRDFVST